MNPTPEPGDFCYRLRDQLYASDTIDRALDVSLSLTKGAFLVGGLAYFFLTRRIFSGDPATQLVWFSNPGLQLYLREPEGFLAALLFAFAIVMLIVRGGFYFLRWTVSEQLLRCAVKKGHGYASFEYGERLVNRVGKPSELDTTQSDSFRFSEFVMKYRRRLRRMLRPLNRLRRSCRRRFGYPLTLRDRNNDRLRRALDAFESVPLAHTLAGSASYWTGLINVRGISKPNPSKAKADFELSSMLGESRAKIELARLLLSEKADGVQSRQLLREAVQELSGGTLRDRALLDLANMSNEGVGVCEPNLDEAWECVNLILSTAPETHEFWQSGSIVLSRHERSANNPGKLLRAEAARLRELLASKRSAALDRALATAEIEKREAIENLMALFAHQFRGPVDSIHINAEHQHDKRLYLKLAGSMSGLLEMFSAASSDPQVLASRLRDDSDGESSIGNVVLNSLCLALAQLLTGSRRRMAPHYLAYAKRRQTAPANLDLFSWGRERTWQTMEKELQKSWERDIGMMLASDDLLRTQEWMAEHLLPIEFVGFEESLIRFSENGTKASLLTVIFTEILLNAVKHASPGTNRPMQVVWSEDEVKIVFSCENPSTLESRTRGESKGTNRGQAFLQHMADKLGGSFHTDVFRDPSIVRLTLPRDIMGREVP